MREYSKVPVQLWINPIGRQIRQLGVDAQLAAFYLITNSHATMIGIYYLPISFISHETGLSFDRALKAVHDLCGIQFCSYDDLSEYIWVHDMAFDQISTHLKPNDNRVKAVNEMYTGLPNLPFLQEFYDKYRKAFCLEEKKENAKLIEASSDTLLSQEQKQEQNQEKKQEISMSGKPDVVSPFKTSSTLQSQALEVLNFLNQKTGRIYRPVDSNIKLIIARLKSGVTVMDCRQVIAKKTRDWLGNPKMSEFLRPATLFNANKFEQYLGELVLPKQGFTHDLH